MQAVFPLGHLHKSEVRQIAARHDLHTVKRKESMGLCFVEPKQKFNEFLSTSEPGSLALGRSSRPGSSSDRTFPPLPLSDEYITPNPGPIYNEAGTLVGEHQGLWSFQIGQRWKIGGRLRGDDGRLYIAGKDIKENAIWVVEGR